MVKRPYTVRLVRDAFVHQATEIFAPKHKTLSSQPQTLINLKCLSHTFVAVDEPASLNPDDNLEAPKPNPKPYTWEHESLLN